MIGITRTSFDSIIKAFCVSRGLGSLAPLATTARKVAWTLAGSDNHELHPMWILTYASNTRVDEVAIELFNRINEQPLLADHVATVRYLMYRTTALDVGVARHSALYRPSCLPAFDVIDELGFEEAKVYAKSHTLPVRLRIMQQVWAAASNPGSRGKHDDARPAQLRSSLCAARRRMTRSPR